MPCIAPLFSGRLAQTMAMGSSRTSGRRCSISWLDESLTQCRSSNTRTTGRSAAIAENRRRVLLLTSARTASPSSRSIRACASPPGERPRIAASGANISSASAPHSRPRRSRSFSRLLSSPSSSSIEQSLRIISRSGQYPIARPNDSVWPSSHRAASPARRRASASSRVFPTPASPLTSTTPPAPAPRRPTTEPSRSRASSRPTISDVSRPPRMSRTGRTPTSRWTITGSRRPLTARRPTGCVLTASPAARAVASLR